MEQERGKRWGTIVIVIALLVLAGSIIFTGIKISSTINANVNKMRTQVKKEIEQDLRREVISFIYAFRSSSIQNRQITPEDLKKGYKFAQDFLSKTK